MKLGVNLCCRRVQELGRLVREAEATGIDLIGLSDSPALYPEAFVQMTIVATETSRVLFGPRVTNPVTRHVQVMAAGMSTLHELSAGRAILGIGVGDSAVHNIGERPARLGELREYVVAFRELLESGEASYRGKRLILPSPRCSVPVYIAASGPKGLKLAAEIGDGVIVGGGVRPELVDRANEILAAGAAASGRSRDDLDVWWLMGGSIHETSSDLARDAMKPLVAAVANAMFSGGLEGRGVPAQYQAPLRQLFVDYEYREHALPGQTWNAALIDELGLTDYLTERFAIAGNPQEFAGRLAEAESWGADQIWLTMPLADKDGFVRAMGADVIPTLRSSGL